MRGGEGVPVWNTKPPSSVEWTQVYAVLTEGDGHVALATWNRFGDGKKKAPEDIVNRYDLDAFSELDRNAALSGNDAKTMELRVCSGQDAVPGLERGQDTPLCEGLVKPQSVRQPVTTPPANNRGRSVPPGARR